MSGAARRARILADARATFLERGEGINGVSMRAIAERGGIDEALIYRHFGSKENLYTEVVTAEVRAAVTGLLARAASLTVGELSTEREQREWQLTYEFIVALLGLPPDVLRAMGTLLCGDREQAAAFYRAALAPAVQAVEDVVRGELSNWSHPPFSPPLAVRATLASCLWHVLEQDLSGQRADPAELARELTDLIFYGIAGARRP